MSSRATAIGVPLLLWYVGLSVWAAIEPADRQFWMMANVLPAVLVGTLIATHRSHPLSPVSYALITSYLTLHTIGVHYTYAAVPLGAWLDQALDLGRNHFDRLVHFSFGLLLSYPMLEASRRFCGAGRWVSYYLAFITTLGLSGLWEIIEAWVAQRIRPHEGLVYLGSQGDVWDAQHDIAAAMYGALLCLAVTALRARVERVDRPAAS